MIASLLFRYTPEELRFIMIDPKVVEMQVYNELPHLVTPVVTDPKKVLLALRWVVDEMELRYQIFAKSGVRNITSFQRTSAAQIRRKRLDAEKVPGERALEERGRERRAEGESSEKMRHRLRVRAMTN